MEWKTLTAGVAEIIKMVYDLLRWFVYTSWEALPMIVITVIIIIAILMWGGYLDATYITGISDGRPALGIIFYSDIGGSL
jgi:hypothetical protein